MAVSTEGRKRQELKRLIKSAATDYRRYVREAAKHEVKLLNAERMKAVCKVSIENFERQLADLGE